MINKIQSSKLINPKLNRNPRVASKRAKSSPRVEAGEIQNYVLYLDTSEPEAEIAIYVFKGGTLGKEGATLVEVKRWLAGRELSATLSDKYKQVLEEAKISQEELSGICVFVGPGSFTGLRIGISFANGLAFALDIPVYETREKNNIKTKKPQKIALPFYDSEPKITKPKKN